MTAMLLGCGGWNRVAVGLAETSSISLFFLSALELLRSERDKSSVL